MMFLRFLLLILFLCGCILIDTVIIESPVSTPTSTIMPSLMPETVMPPDSLEAALRYIEMATVDSVEGTPPVTIDPVILSTAINTVLEATQTAHSASLAPPYANDIFVTHFDCTHPQVLRVGLVHDSSEPFSLLLDGVTTEFENIESLTFAIAVPSSLSVIHPDGIQLYPQRATPIGACAESGTPDAPLNSHPELMVFPLVTTIECPLSFPRDSTIGAVVVNAGGLNSGAFRLRVVSSTYNTPVDEFFVDYANLPARTSSIYLFDSSWQTSMDQNQISIVVDSDNQVSELREDNNVTRHSNGCFPIT